MNATNKEADLRKQFSQACVGQPCAIIFRLVRSFCTITYKHASKPARSFIGACTVAVWQACFHQHKQGCSYAPGRENVASIFAACTPGISCHFISSSTLRHCFLHLLTYSRRSSMDLMSAADSSCASCRRTPSAISRAISIHGMLFNWLCRRAYS